MKEYKEIPGYEKCYKIDRHGNIKSIERYINAPQGRSRLMKEQIIKTRKNVDGYYTANLSNNAKRKTYKVHQLVAMTYLNHKPCGMEMVVDHINSIKTDNRVENLRVVTQRENSYTHVKGSSKYKGVSWYKHGKKWVAHIRMNGKSKYLGYYDNEIDASNAYQKKLLELK